MVTAGLGLGAGFDCWAAGFFPKHISVYVTILLSVAMFKGLIELCENSWLQAPGVWAVKIKDEKYRKPLGRLPDQTDILIDEAEGLSTTASALTHHGYNSPMIAQGNEAESSK